MTSGIKAASLEWSALTGLMRNDINKPLCDHCGQTLENFLNQMEEHNLEVVCPSCGKTVRGGKNEEADESNGDKHGSNRPRNQHLSTDSSRGNSLKQKKH